MLSKIKFSNFYSFYDETEICFEISKKPSSSYFDFHTSDGTRLNKVISIIGPNGSGKTQLLRPLAFISWFISRSYQNSEPESKIPFTCHKLFTDEPTTIELEFHIGLERYRYKLIITTKEVIYESLHKKTSHLYSYIFIRERKGDKYSFKQQGFGFNKNIAENKIRGNSSIIAAAHSHDSEYATKIANYFKDYSSNVRVSGRDNYHEGALLESAEYFKTNKQIHNKAIELICDLDLGLSSIDLIEAKRVDQNGNEEEFALPVGIHSSDKGKFSLPFFEESSGTKSAYVLLRDILPILESGGVVIFDELDNDLHPHMVEKIIELFKFEYSNPHNAQLIFSCHTPEILNILKKHQVYLVEKDNLCSETWRLDEVKGLRSDDNIYAKYMAGALSAIPNL